ncbi:MAG: shikimate kinase [Rhizomicrobium sp.]
MTGLKRTVALVGMMGAGKSSVGRRLADRLCVPFRDADTEIEMAAGCPINDIFEQYGEPAFRAGERKVILRLLREPPHVLATGGGAMLDAATRAQLGEHAVSVWLRAPLDVLLSRVGRRDSRPLLRNGSPRETLARLLTEREPIYAACEIVIDVGNEPHATAVARIIAALSDREIVIAQ